MNRIPAWSQNSTGVKQSRAIEGRWWIHGKDKPPLFGILSYDPEKDLELSVKMPQSRSNDEVLHAMVEGRANDGVPEIIYGADESNRAVTLSGCRLRKRFKRAGLDTYEIKTASAILNARCDSWDKAQFPVVGVKFTLLTDWLDQELLQAGSFHARQGQKNSVYKAEFALHDVLEFQLGKDVRIKIQEQTAPDGSLRDFNIKQEHIWFFLFPNPLSVEAIYSRYVSVLTRLMTMLTGERVFIEELKLLNKDPFIPGGDSLKCAELLIPNPGVNEATRRLHAAHMIASYPEIGSQLSTVLQRWFDCHDRLEPVLDLYFGVFSNWLMTDESRFLFLAQALEVYHARSAKFTPTERTEEKHAQRVKTILAGVASKKYRDWLEYRLRFSNEKPLSRRIDDVLKSCAKESAQLTAKVDDFTAKVVASRNYYTHYSRKILQDGKVAKGLELRRIAFALFDLLQVCLLKELGIEEKPIERILEQNASVIWSDLKKH